MTLSEMKCTMTPAFASQAMNAMSETSKDVPGREGAEARRIAAGNLTK
jgi:hypothetical protein